MRPKQSSRYSTTSPTIIFGELRIGIYCHGHYETTPEGIKRQPIYTSKQGSLFEVYESRANVQDDCFAYCAIVYG